VKRGPGSLPVLYNANPRKFVQAPRAGEAHRETARVRRDLAVKHVCAGPNAGRSGVPWERPRGDRRVRDEKSRMADAIEACEMKQRLLASYEADTKAFSDAVTQLHQRTGTSSKATYAQLKDVVECARLKSEQSPLALEQHVINHQCWVAVALTGTLSGHGGLDKLAPIINYVRRISISAPSVLSAVRVLCGRARSRRW
jgi:hypothetical protein